MRSDPETSQRAIGVSGRLRDRRTGDAPFNCACDSVERAEVPAKCVTNADELPGFQATGVHRQRLSRIVARITIQRMIDILSVTVGPMIRVIGGMTTGANPKLIMTVSQMPSPITPTHPSKTMAALKSHSPPDLPSSPPKASTTPKIAPSNSGSIKVIGSTFPVQRAFLRRLAISKRLVSLDPITETVNSLRNPPCAACRTGGCSRVSGGLCWSHFSTLSGVVATLALGSRGRLIDPRSKFTRANR
jgi:hypothetical protein